VKTDINLSLDKILRLQKEAVTPQGRIRAFREAKAEMEAAANKIETLKTLVASAGSMGTMFGFIGGVQTLGVWGMIIIFIAGVVFLALYLRQISLSGKEKKIFRMSGFLGNLKKVSDSRAVRFLAIMALSFGLTVWGFSLALKIKNSGNSLPAPTSTPTPTAAPVQEIEINEEKQVLGEYIKSGEVIKLIIPAAEWLEVREAPTALSKLTGRLGKNEKIEKLTEWEDWVKIRWEKEGVGCVEGWVNKKFIHQ